MYLLLRNLSHSGTEYVAGDLLESGIELVNYQKLVDSGVLKELKSEPIIGSEIPTPTPTQVAKKKPVANKSKLSTETVTSIEE